MPYRSYWRDPGGYTVVTNTGDVPIQHNGHRLGAFSQLETHSITCCHCGAVEIVESGAHQNIHRCTCCDDFICNGCVGKGCAPLQKNLGLYEKEMKKIEQRQLDAHLLNEFGKSMLARDLDMVHDLLRTRKKYDGRLPK